MLENCHGKFTSNYSKFLSSSLIERKMQQIFSPTILKIWALYALLKDHLLSLGICILFVRIEIISYFKFYQGSWTLNKSHMHPFEYQVCRQNICDLICEQFLSNHSKSIRYSSLVQGDVLPWAPKTVSDSRPDKDVLGAFTPKHSHLIILDHFESEGSISRLRAFFTTTLFWILLPNKFHFISSEFMYWKFCPFFKLCFCYDSVKQLERDCFDLFPFCCVSDSIKIIFP